MSIYNTLLAQHKNNSVEYESAFKIYKETVVKPIQQEFEKALKRVGINIKLTEFIIDFGDNAEGGGIA